MNYIFFKITIVTVVYNNESTIEETIQSVLKQTYSNIEYIIIDGASTDKTVSVIEKYKERINKIISEKDSGIYDAMNKGINYASGDYIFFLNSGDIFNTNDVIESVFNNIHDYSNDIIYGDFVAVNRNKNLKAIIKAKPVSKIWKGMIFSHQSVFIKTSLSKKHPFNIQYKIAADYNQILELYKLNSKFLYIPLIISETSIGGLSYSNINTTLERIKILRKNNAKPIFIFSQYKKIPMDLLRIILGAKLSDVLREIKWNISYK